MHLLKKKYEFSCISRGKTANFLTTSSINWRHDENYKLCGAIKNFVEILFYSTFTYLKTVVFLQCS